MIISAITTLSLAAAPVTPGCTPPSLFNEAPATTPPVVPATVPTLPVVLAPATPAALPGDPEEVVVTARAKSAADPLAVVNAKSFAVTQSIDTAVVAPVAHAYAHGVPGPLRQGLHNALSNIQEPTAGINFLLQFKVGKAVVALGRFAINSTIGVAGLLDVAKRHSFSLKHRVNSFADTLGFYGVKPGPFFFLPLIGPTTLRDVIGNTVERLFLPTAIGKPFNDIRYTVPAGFVSALDYRTKFDEKLGHIRNSADPYVAARDYYLQRRQAEIDGLHTGRRAVPVVTVPPAKAAEPSSLSRPPC